MSSSFFGKLILIICCGVIFSCNRENCFQQIHLGMLKPEYDQLMSGYHTQGIVRKVDYRTNSLFENYEYDLSNDIHAIINPAFNDDTLKEFRIIIVDVKNKEGVLEEVRGWLKRNYTFEAIPSGEDEEYKVGTFKIQVGVTNNEQYDPAAIGIGFRAANTEYSSIPATMSMLSELGFLHQLKTCDAAQELALKDFNNGIYRIVKYGLLEEGSIKHTRDRYKQYSLDIRLGGCISSETGYCYTNKMYELLYRNDSIHKTLPDKNKKLLSMIERKGRSLAPTYQKAVCTEFIINAVGKLVPLSKKAKIDIRIITNDDLAKLVEKDSPVTKGVVTALVRSGQGVNVDNAANVLPGDLVHYWDFYDETAYGHCGVVRNIKPGVSITLYSSHPVTNGFGSHTFEWPEKAYFVRLK